MAQERSLPGKILSEQVIPNNTGMAFTAKKGQYMRFFYGRAYGLCQARVSERESNAF